MRKKSVPKNVQEDVRGKTKKKTKNSDMPYRDTKAIVDKIRELFARDDELCKTRDRLQNLFNDGYEAGKSEARNREMVNK